MNGLKIKEVESITVTVKTEDDEEYKIVYHYPFDTEEIFTFVTHILDYGYTTQTKTNISFYANTYEFINISQEKPIKTEVNVSKYFELFE